MSGPTRWIVREGTERGKGRYLNGDRWCTFQESATASGTWSGARECARLESIRHGTYRVVALLDRTQSRAKAQAAAYRDAAALARAASLEWENDGYEHAGDALTMLSRKLEDMADKAWPRGKR